MRRAVVLVVLLATLGLGSAASASLEPIRRDFGDVSLPRVHPSDLSMPAHRTAGRVSVLLRLRGAPLASWYARQESAQHSDRLQPRSTDARRRLAALEEAQAAAERSLLAAVPSARVERRFSVLLNALAVELPATDLAKAARLGWVTHVYPSLRYTLSLNRSPGLIGAGELTRLTGAKGDGMKIAIVDDGVDAGNPFFDPSTFSFPNGFPKGNRSYTTPKVIVARSFPAFGAPESANLPFDPSSSFHGTHVAGIAAGVAGTTAPAGADHPETTGLSGVAPRAWIGNYRVFSLPTPTGDSANTPEIIAAFEQAVLDGMDVINFSAGGPEVEPANDALVETITNVALAGVVPVISAGNERDAFGLGSIGSPGTAADAITVGAATNAHVFAPTISIRAPDVPAELASLPYQAEIGAEVPASWQDTDQVVVDPGSLVGTDGHPVDRFLCAPGPDPNASETTLSPDTLDGALAVVFRGRCGLSSKLARAVAAGAAGVLMVNNRPGEPQATGLFEAPIPTLFLADLDGARLRDFLEQHGGRAPARIGLETRELDTGRPRGRDELLVSRPDSLSSRPQA